MHGLALELDPVRIGCCGASERLHRIMHAACEQDGGKTGWKSEGGIAIFHGGLRSEKSKYEKTILAIS